MTCAVAGTEWWPGNLEEVKQIREGVFGCFEEFRGKQQGFTIVDAAHDSSPAIVALGGRRVWR